jgi:FkbM family methyltransferase
MVNMAFNESQKTSLSVMIDFHGRKINFEYPNNIFMQNIIKLIFEGKEYPLLNIPGYSPTLIIDVGANIGATAIYFLYAFPNSKIQCYEPSLRNYYYLKKNTEYFDNITADAYGLYNKSCEAKLYYGSSQSAQDSIIKSSETTEGYEFVKLVKVSEEIEKKNIKEISILKVDTEGCEVPILTEFLKFENIDIDFVYTEYHSENDKLTINELFSKRFTLFYSSPDRLLAYISKNLLTSINTIKRI